MATKFLVNIEDLINIEELEHLLHTYTAATKMVSLVTDYRGNPITTIKRFSPICQAVRKDPEKAKRCIKCDALSGLEASMKGEPCIYRCHAGLVEVTSAIMIDEKPIANIMTGQIVVSEEDQDKIPFLCEDRTDLQSDPELAPIYEDYIRTTRPMTLEQIENYANLIAEMANFIAKAGYENILKQRIAEQDHKLLESKNLKLKSKLMVNQYSSMFLNEAFNTIYNQAILENADTTAKLLYSLSGLFKRNIATDTHYISVSKEIEDIHNIIDLYNISFDQHVELKVVTSSAINHELLPLIGVHAIISNVFLTALPKSANANTTDIELSITKEKQMVKIKIFCDALQFPDLNFKFSESLSDLELIFSKESTFTLKLIINHLSDFYSGNFEMYIEDRNFVMKFPSILK